MYELYKLEKAAILVASKRAEAVIDKGFVNEVRDGRD